MEAIKKLSFSEKALIVLFSIIIYFSFFIKGLDQGEGGTLMIRFLQVYKNSSKTIILLMQEELMDHLIL